MLVDCTFVFRHPELRSGIQRVVRNIVGNTKKVPLAVECIPVVFKDGKTYRAHKLIASLPERIVCRIHDDLCKLVDRLSYKSGDRYRGRRGTSKGLVSALSYVGRSASVYLLLPPRVIFGKVRRLLEHYYRIQQIHLNVDDVLILLDSSWHKSFHQEIEIQRSRGNTVVGVIYDVIPLTHPQYCDEELVKQFEVWFDWISEIGSGFMAISEATMEQTKQIMRSKLQPDEFEAKWFDFFYLGSELDLKGKSGVRNKIGTIFQSNRPIYLMVSTIEPRKNHRYLLDAFDILWERGVDIALFFIGHSGWKNETLLDRIEKHPQLNVRLFVLNDVNDTELEYAYQNSKALVFPSFVEGFGLPLVEAMQRGLPAMASDIPVFREVGGSFCAYFDLGDPESLVKLVNEYESTGQFPAAMGLGDWQWPGWRDSATQLFSRTLEHITQRPA